jgi:hypothetical protein
MKLDPATLSMVAGLALIAAGCGRESALPEGNGPEPRPAATSPPAGQPAAVPSDPAHVQPGLPSPTAPPTSALCAATGGTEMTFANTNDARRFLGGRWILCSGPGLSWADAQRDQAGIDLGADMSWHLLRGTDEAVARADGFQAAGMYRFQPPQDLDFAPARDALLFFGIDYSFVTLTMLDSPRKMHWSNGSVYARMEEPAEQ